MCKPRTGSNEPYQNKRLLVTVEHIPVTCYECNNQQFIDIQYISCGPTTSQKENERMRHQFIEEQTTMRHWKAMNNKQDHENFVEHTIGVWHSGWKKTIETAWYPCESCANSKVQIWFWMTCISDARIVAGDWNPITQFVLVPYPTVCNGSSDGSSWHYQYMLSLSIFKHS